MARIFLSYRRSDSDGYAGRLYDRLSQHFSRENLFMDIDTIQLGYDFVEVIENAVGSCDVLLAIIGRQWLGATDDTGQRRLDNPEDFVRLEITAALERNIPVIPVLVGNATMPRSMDLPDVLRPLARRQALTVGGRFHPEVDHLIKSLETILTQSSKPTITHDNSSDSNTPDAPIPGISSSSLPLDKPDTNRLISDITTPLAHEGAEQSSAAKSKTTLDVTYKKGNGQIGTFTIRNIGGSIARNIILKIDTATSKFIYIDMKEFLINIRERFKFPDLSPGRCYDVNIKFDSSESTAHVLWSWENPDDSYTHEEHTFNLWS